MIIIRHAKIHTMEPNAAPFTGDILLDADRILEIGIDLSAPSAKVIDAKDLIYVPGLIDAHSHIGLQEGEMRWEGNNTDEIADPVAPHLSAFDAVNPQDPCVQEALSGGITAVATGPGSANVLGGQFTLLKTGGSTVQDIPSPSYEQPEPLRKRLHWCLVIPRCRRNSARPAWISYLPYSPASGHPDRSSQCFPADAMQSDPGLMALYRDRKCRA